MIETDAKTGREFERLTALEAARQAASARRDPRAINASRDWPGWEPSEDRPLTCAPVVAEDGARWEMDVNGHHRIVLADGTGGDWTDYGSPAVSACGTLTAFTANWDGYFPIESVLRLELLPTKTRPSEFAPGRTRD